MLFMVKKEPFQWNLEEITEYSWIWLLYYLHVIGLGQAKSHIWCSCLCCSTLTICKSPTYAFKDQRKNPTVTKKPSSLLSTPKGRTVGDMKISLILYKFYKIFLPIWRGWLLGERQDEGSRWWGWPGSGGDAEGHLQLQKPQAKVSVKL